MIRFQRILVPVDLSEQCRRAVPFVKSIAKRFESEVTLLHVMELPTMYYAPPEAAAWAVVSNLESFRAAQETEFDAFIKKEFCPMPVRREMVEGEPSCEILDFARNGNFDLIMLPTHGYGVFRRFLLGSVTAKVLYDAECPVWTGVHSGELLAHDTARLKQILCAVGNELRDSHVVRWAVDFAVKVGAELTLVHAVEHVDAVHSESDRAYREAVFEATRAEVNAIQTAAGTSVPVVLRAGKLAQVVRNEAQDRHADMVIIGRGEHRLSRLRSDDYEIIRESPCPVVSI